MSAQSPRDALARRIAIQMDPMLALNDVWRQHSYLINMHPDDPTWYSESPYRKAYAMADLVLAWLAEPAQIEAMAIGYFNSGGSCDWTDWNSVDGTTLQNAVRARQMDAVAALRGKP